MSDLPDQQQIIEQLTAQREEALAEYFAACQQRLKRIVNFRLDYRLGGRVSESDVLQDTYVRAAKRIDSYLDKPSMPFFVWLRLELNQRMIELHRHHFGADRRDVRREVSGYRHDNDATSMAIAAHIVAGLTSASQLIERAEQIAAVEKSLEQMQDLDREVIALRHFEELTNIETAEVLGITPGAASKRYLRALKRLREIFEFARQQKN
ncbi:MAG: sigma-70 family RNA polymerase sigma factor [Planctomycetota bacterium]